MDVHEFLSVRVFFNRAKELLPQAKAEKRLSFEEYALLAHVKEAKRPPSLSELADYQGVSKATVTQRVSFLEKSGLLRCIEADEDKRLKTCFVEEAGQEKLDYMGKLLSEQTSPSFPLYCSAPERMTKYVDAVGSQNLSNKDLVVLALGSMHKSNTSVFQISRALALSLPTTRNVFKKLLAEEIATSSSGGTGARKLSLSGEKDSPRRASMENEQFRLTVKGKTLAKKEMDRIAALKVRRNRIGTEVS